jgi:hypothetical protein
MAPFAGNAVGPAQELAADDDAAPDAGPQDDPEDDGRAGARPIRRLGDGKAIGIIGQAQRPAEGARQILVEGAAVEPGGIGVLDQAGRGRDRSRHADSDEAGAAARLALRLRHHLGDGCQGCLVVLPRRGAPEAASGDALPVEGEGLDLGAAQIDADAHSRSSLS